MFLSRSVDLRESVLTALLDYLSSMNEQLEEIMGRKFRRGEFEAPVCDAYTAATVFT